MMRKPFWTASALLKSKQKYALLGAGLFHMEEVCAAVYSVAQLISFHNTPAVPMKRLSILTKADDEIFALLVTTDQLMTIRFSDSDIFAPV